MGKRGIELTNRDFLAYAFFRSSADEMPWVTSFAGDPKDVARGVWFGRPALPLPQFIRPTANNYIVVSTFKRADDGRFHRRKDCFAGLFMVMV
ncbi:MAG TPA: hypothetical protein PKH67_00005, partial [Rhodocyclaceae bacterium]|nr:hypothetical protein [Rhodocyclaceae bacterium]